MNDGSRTPAQVYALVFGVVLLLAGITGFIADAAFGDLGGDVQGDDLILFEVNGWHNLVHIASGALGLALMGTARGARAYALGFGAVYLLVTIYGFVDGNDVIGLLPVNTADNFLHLGISLAGIAAGLISPADDSPGRSRARTA
jgi:hypothetical protein